MKLFFQMTALVLAVFMVTSCGGDKGAGSAEAPAADSVQASDSVPDDVADTMDAVVEEAEAVEEAASEAKDEIMESQSEEVMDSMPNQ